MAVVMRKVRALLFQRVAGLICALPPGSSAPHALRPVALTHASIGHPTAVLDLRLPSLPVCNELAPHVCMGGIAGHRMDQAEAMAHPRATVVALILGDTSGMLRCLPRLAQLGMLTLFPPKDRGQRGGLEGLDGRRMGTQAVVRDEALAGRGGVAQLSHKALGGLPFASIFGGAIAVHHRLGHERHDGPLVWMDERSPQHLRRRGDGAVAVDAVETGGTVKRRGRKILRTVQRQEGVTIEALHRFQRLAPLALSQDARA